MNTVNRVLPHSLEAEQAILGSMLVYPSVVKTCFDMDLDKSDFFLESHQKIYDAMMYLNNNGKAVDAVNLITRLQDTSLLQLVGNADYILALADTAVSSANCSSLIETIKNRAHMRQLIMTAEVIVNDGFDASLEIDELMDKAEKEILAVTRNRRTSELKSSRLVIRNVIDELIRLRNAKNRVTGIATGYHAMDRMTNGFQRGDLIILAARPSMGKTAFALNLGLQASLRNKGAIGIFSLEMPAEHLMKRILSARAMVEGNALRNGQLSDEDFNKLSETENELSECKIFIDDSAVINLGDIFSKCRKLKSEHELDLVIIDYLQLIAGSGKAGDNRQQEVSDISRGLKALARELEVPVIALSQLSRSVETRQDKRPMLSDLRESGAIEQDADIVMFLYRDEYYNKDEEKTSPEDRTEVLIAKHRNGETGKVELAFNKNINAFFNYEENY